MSVLFVNMCVVTIQTQTLKRCPCGQPSRGGSNRSRYCKRCYQIRYARKPCPECGKPMEKRSQICAECRWGPPFQPRQMSEAETAWVAGLLEGEGSFIATAKSLAIQAAMTDRDVIDRLAAVTGVGVMHLRRPQRAHHKPSWLWQVKRRAHIHHIAEAVLPWLGERRRAAALALLARVTQDS
jgi:hypothetical protein